MQQQPVVARVARGDLLVLTAPGNPTTGYTWFVAHTPPCLTFVGDRYVQRPQSAARRVVGEPSIWQLEYAVTGVCSNNAPLVLVYGQQWDSSTWTYQTVFVQQQDKRRIKPERVIVAV